MFNVKMYNSLVFCHLVISYLFLADAWPAEQPTLHLSTPSLLVNQGGNKVHA